MHFGANPIKDGTEEILDAGQSVPNSRSNRAHHRAYPCAGRTQGAVSMGANPIEGGTKGVFEPRQPVVGFCTDVPKKVSYAIFDAREYLANMRSYPIEGGPNRLPEQGEGDFCPLDKIMHIV